MRYFKTFKGIFAASVKEGFAYRSHIVISIFNGPFLLFVQYYIWKGIFSSKSEIGGFTFNSMIAYFVLTTLINYLVSDFIMHEMQYLVRNGEFIIFMLKPISFIRYAFYQKLGSRFVAFLFEFSPVLIILQIIFHIKLLPKDAILFILSLCLSFIITFLFNFIMGTIAFWTVRTGSIIIASEVVKMIFTGAFIPLVFFPQIMRKLFMFLPFQYMTYMPVMLFGGKTGLPSNTISPWGAVSIQAVYAFLLALITIYIWDRGIKKFTGVGV